MIGFHTTFANPMADIIATAISYELETFQIFTRNARNMRQRFISNSEIAWFNTELLRNGYSKFVIHAPYSMNPASPEKRKRDNAVRMIKEDMEFISKLAGVKYYVLHPGSHMGCGIDAGVEFLSETLHRVGKTTTTICVEIMAGSGNELMSTMECIYKLLASTVDLNVKLTFDTCHAFGAGLPIVETYSKLKDYIEVVHVNDSQGVFGSRIDRHLNLGYGIIDIDDIKWLIENVKKDIPIILETPAEHVLSDLRLLKRFNLNS